MDTWDYKKRKRKMIKKGAAAGRSSPLAPLLTGRRCRTARATTSLHPPVPTKSAMPTLTTAFSFSVPSSRHLLRRRRRTPVAAARRDIPSPNPPQSALEAEIECVGTGADTECFIPTNGSDASPLELEEAIAFKNSEYEGGIKDRTFLREMAKTALLVSPFFFWGTAMVAMKGVIPKTGPFFVAATRLVPSGGLVVAFAALKGRKMPKGLQAWASIAAFAAVDAACFQGFLAEGLQKTSAGLGSVIIDSQPLTVAILASLLFGESIGTIGAAGLILGIIGLLLLELPAISQGGSSTLWGSGEWWMLLAAQSMAVGTVMVRWVSKYSDSIMATGWHMIIGGIPLLAISALNHDPALDGHVTELAFNDILALCYSSIFGSAVSYGVYFYNATQGSLTQLSSLTFLTPMFAALFGYIILGETFSPLQVAGAFVTLVAIYMVNYKSSSEK